MTEGTIRVQTEGYVVGQINGLAVIQAGPAHLRLPHAHHRRRSGRGPAGAINIEREAQLSGAIHTKGFYILGGLLRYLLRTRPPAGLRRLRGLRAELRRHRRRLGVGRRDVLPARALTDIPLRQDLAMTGAIDQLGNILPIGAVNEKIEGFFDTCRDIGLTGTQGVIIPQANAGDLMLREDVVDACREGTFHVYAVGTIHEALGLFTGLLPGRREARGAYAPETVLGRAVEEARRYWEMAAKPMPRSEA